MLVAEAVAWMGQGVTVACVLRFIACAVEVVRAVCQLHHTITIPAACVQRRPRLSCPRGSHTLRNKCCVHPCVP